MDCAAISAKLCWISEVRLTPTGIEKMGRYTSFAHHAESKRMSNQIMHDGTPYEWCQHHQRTEDYQAHLEGRGPFPCEYFVRHPVTTDEEISMYFGRKEEAQDVKVTQTYSPRSGLSVTVEDVPAAEIDFEDETDVVFDRAVAERVQEIVERYAASDLGGVVTVPYADRDDSDGEVQG